MHRPTKARMDNARRTALAAAGGIASLFACAFAAVPAGSAHAQVEISMPGAEGPGARAVMSGREWDALVEASGLDPAQRTAADAIFDDAQARMFESKRTADEAARRAGLFDPSRDAVVARAAAARAMRTALLAQVDELFASLAAIARPEQQAALAHERRMARLRAIRATMPGPTFTEFGARSGNSDVPTAIESARIEGLDAAAVHEAVAGTLDRLADALLRLADARTEREVAQAEALADRSAAAKAASARSQAKDALALVSRVQRDSIAALDGALSGAALQGAKAGAAGTIWPSTADARSPRRVLDQLLRAESAPERRAALEAVRDAWWAAWWPATLRLVEATESEAPGRAPTDATDARDAANRAAWRALAGLDPAHRDFHLANAEPPVRTKGGAVMIPFGRSPEPGLPGTEPGPGAGPAGGVSIAFSTVSVISSGDGVGGEMTIAAGNADDAGGAVTLAIGEALEGAVADQVIVMGDAIALGDPGIELDLGADGPADMGIAFEGVEGIGAQAPLAGARVPAAMTDEDIRRIPAALGIRADEGVVAQVAQDYRDRVKASEDDLVARIRDALKGTAVRWFMPDIPQMAGMPAPPEPQPEVPIADLRRGIELLDQWTDRLGALDDGVIDALAALGSPRPEAVQAARERRARARAGALRYPSAMGWDGRRPFVEPADALSAAGADQAVLAAASTALEAWSPGALAAIESSREAMRGECVALIEYARGDAARPRAVDAPGIEVDEESMRLRAASEARLAKARRAVGGQAIAGRDAAEAALPEPLRPAFRSAWNALAVPSAYRDRSDALPAVDRARGLGDLTDAQRAQLDALRNEHASRHRAACDAIAEMTLAQQSRMEDAMQSESSDGMDSMFGAARLLSDARFERRELDSRTLRRLRATLTPDQAKEVPQLRPRGAGGAGMRSGPPGAATIVIPAPTPAAPAPTSP